MTKNTQSTRNTQFNTWYWIAAILGILVIQYLFGTAGRIATIPYSEFQGLLQGGKVAEIGISDNFIQGKLKEPLREWADAVLDHPRRSRLRAGAPAVWGQVHRPDRKHVPSGHPVLDPARPRLLRHLGLISYAAWRPRAAWAAG